YPAYDTKQAFSDAYPHQTYSMLPPWLTHGVFRVPRDARFYMRLTRIYWKRFNRPLMAVAAFVLGIVLTTSVLVIDQVDARNSTADTEATPDTPAPTVDLTAYRRARITGYAQLGDLTTYRLLDGDNRPTTSHDLERQGLTVVPMGACHLRLASGAQHADIGC
ncbi:assembly protein, partial [Salinicola socius]